MKKIILYTILFSISFVVCYNAHYSIRIGSAWVRLRGIILSMRHALLTYTFAPPFTFRWRGRTCHAWQ